MMLMPGSFVRVKKLNATGMILFGIIGFQNVGELSYMVYIQQGKGNENVKQFFKTDFMCHCSESELEVVCLN